jgi:Flp pilus assembly protein TadG
MKRFANEEGGSLVEMALVCTLLISVLFGIIEFSFAFYSYNFTAEAAKEAARYLSVRGSNSCIVNKNLTNCGVTSNATITNYVQNLGYFGINSSTTVVATWPDTCGLGSATPLAANCMDPGSRVKVVVNYTFPITVPFWNYTNLNMQSTAEMVISN